MTRGPRWPFRPAPRKPICRRYPSGVASGARLRRRRRERDGGFGSEQEEGHRLLKVEAHDALVMAQIADRDVLADMQVEIAAPGGEHEGPVNGRGPDDLVVDELLHVLEHRIAIVDGLGEGGIRVGAEQDGIGSVDADETKLAQRLRDRIRILTHVGRQRHDRIAGPLPHATDARGRVAFENGPVLGIGDFLRRVLRGLPVRVVRAPFDVVDLLAIELEGDSQFNQGLHLALAREDSFGGRGDRLEMAASDRGKGDAARTLDIDHAPSGEIALESARRFLFEAGPRRIGDRGKLAVKIVHGPFSPLSEPIPSEPSDAAPIDGSAGGGWAGAWVAGASPLTESRNVSEGTKNSVPVAARLKSSSRS